MGANVAWIRDILRKVDAAKTDRPTTSEKLVEIPNGVERLKSAVLNVRKVVRTLELDRSVIERDHRETLREYQRAYEIICKEYDSDCEKNDMEMSNAMERLHKLWLEWIRISKDDIGVYAALPGAEMPDAPPIPTREPDAQELEWQDTEQ